MTRLRRDDTGTALVEFTHLAVLLMVPLVYVLLLVFTLQRAGFAVSTAAREAGRAFVTASSDTAGREQAERAVRLVLQDHRLDASQVTVTLTPLADLPGAEAGLPPTRGVRIEVRHVVTLPVIGGLFGGRRVGAIPVTGEHVAILDTFRAR